MVYPHWMNRSLWMLLQFSKLLYMGSLHPRMGFWVPEMSYENGCTTRELVLNELAPMDLFTLHTALKKCLIFSDFVPDILSLFTWLMETWVLRGSGLMTCFLITASSVIFHHLKLHSMKNEGEITPFENSLRGWDWGQSWDVLLRTAHIYHHPPQAEGQEMSWTKTAAIFHHRTRCWRLWPRSLWASCSRYQHWECRGWEGDTTLKSLRVWRVGRVCYAWGSECDQTLGEFALSEDFMASCLHGFAHGVLALVPCKTCTKSSIKQLIGGGGVSRLVAGFLGLFSICWGSLLAAFPGSPPEQSSLCGGRNGEQVTAPGHGRNAQICGKEPVGSAQCHCTLLHYRMGLSASSAGMREFSEGNHAKKTSSARKTANSWLW